MEIEPSVEHAFVLHLPQNLSHFLTNPLLATLLVNQVDEVLLLVLLTRFFHMQTCSLETEHVLRVDFDGWRPLHCWLHLPNQRNRATCLDMRWKVCCAIFIENYDVFSFGEVCSRAFVIKASRDEPSTWSTAVSARNQCESNLFCLLYTDESENARSSERCKLRLSERVEQIVIKCKLLDIVYAVWKHRFNLTRETWCEDLLNVLLHALGDVDLVAEVEGSLLLNRLDHVHIRLVLSCYVERSVGLVHWHKYEWLHTEHRALWNFADLVCGIDQNEIGVRKQFDLSKDTIKLKRLMLWRLADFGLVLNSVIHHFALAFRWKCEDRTLPSDSDETRLQCSECVRSVGRHL